MKTSWNCWFSFLVAEDGRKRAGKERKVSVQDLDGLVGAQANLANLANLPTWIPTSPPPSRIRTVDAQTFWVSLDAENTSELMADICQINM